MASNLRFVVAIALLAGTGFFLHARAREEVVPSRQAFAAFPYRLGSWSGVDIDVPAEVLQVLGSGDFLVRSYQHPQAEDPPVELFIAYFPSQRFGETVHSPRQCLPGAGWFPLETSRVTIRLPGRSPFEANRYLMARRSSRQLVLYWYGARGRAIASEYWAKFYLVEDSIRLGRSDGSLIRASTEMLPGESAATAEHRLLGLLKVITPELETYVPR